MNRRKTKLIQPRLQLTLVSWFLGVAIVALILQVILLSGYLTQFAGAMPDQGPELAAEGLRMLAWGFLVSLLFLVPVTVGVGILITFRIAGPIYRFEQHLDSIVRGEEVGPCRIRKGDQLQGLCQKINAAVEALSARKADGDAEREREAA